MLTPGIVHIGTGAFFRAFVALYTDDAIKLSKKNHWGIIAANLFHGHELADAFKWQNQQYNVLEIDSNGTESCKTVDAVLDILPVRDNREPLLKWLSHAQIRLVTLTITEKGYCLNPADGTLMLDHSLIEHDLQNPGHPKSAIGLLVEALNRRQKQNIKPFAILSCDNIPDNGQRLRKALLAYAEVVQPGLAEWMEETVKTPSTMVDRIVPAITPEALKQVSNHTGMDDPCAVVTEKFRQWVIEDDLPESPPWYQIESVKFVPTVHPYETMKLRVLNGSHSLIAYAGSLAGYETIADAIQDDNIARLVKRYMLQEAIPTLPPVDIDLKHYAESLLERFANQSLKHRTIQVAMDGSQKIPQRWLAGLEQLLNQQKDCTCTLLGIACWLRFLGGLNDNGKTLDVQDPLAEELQATVSRYSDQPEQLVRQLLGETRVFQPALAGQPRVNEQLTTFYREAADNGVLATLKQLL